MTETDKPSILSKVFAWVGWLIIILLIAGIGYVFYINRYIPATPAQIQQVNTDLQSLAQALQKAKQDTGYYVTLETLDDLPGVGMDTTFPIMPKYNIQSEPIPFVVDNNGFLTSSLQFPYNKWKGPYTTFQNNWVGIQYSNQGGSFQGPGDPWGNLYKLYTPRDIIKREPRDPVQSMVTTFTLISYGPDNEPGYKGSPPGTGDDIYYSF